MKADLPCGGGGGIRKGQRAERVERRGWKIAGWAEKISDIPGGAGVGGGRGRWTWVTCFNPLPEPPDPRLVEVHAPSSTPDVDVMFGVSLLGKIRHISLFSAPMAKVRVYHVKYVHHESVLLAEAFTVSQIIFHPECPDTAARNNLLGPANPLVSEAQDFLSRVIEAVTAYGSAEQLSLARDHYLSTSKPLSLTEKIAQLHLQTGKIFDPMPEIAGAFISNEFFSEEEEALVMSFSADENHQWLSEGHCRMLHFGFRYNPKT